MTLARDLSSSNLHDIQLALFSLLDQVTNPAVLEFDKQYEAASDKQAILSEFESSILYERWARYRSIQLELLDIINQKATLNRVADIKKEIKSLRLTLRTTDKPSKYLTPDDAKHLSFSKFQQHLDQPKEDTPIPGIIDSIDRTIQDEALRGVTIKQSISVLKKMKLQIVGTEHPTDPLSQEARNILIKLANAIDEINPDEAVIKKLLEDLQKADPIPPSKRTVIEEVNRNIDITLTKLYDNVPYLVQEILDAYKTHYGEEAFKAHEEELWKAMEGLLRDASWPGFDADGNENITAMVMVHAIRSYRIRIVEKHITTLHTNVCKRTKEIEHQLRTKIKNLGKELYYLSRKYFPTAEIDGVNICDIFFESSDNASELSDKRRFSAIVTHFNALISKVSTLNVDEGNRNKLVEIITDQLNTAQALVELTRFSGSYRLENDSVLYQGEVQRFMDEIEKYKDATRDKSDAASTKDQKEVIVNQFNGLLSAHTAALKKHPDLYHQMRVFGVQLHSFGMTYGKVHIRQDSSVFREVWNIIIDDLKEQFAHLELFKFLKGRHYESRRYSELTEEEQVIFHKKLQSKENHEILEAIYPKDKNCKYLSDEKYKHNPSFSPVRTEIERLELTTHYPDMFENIIISNCENAANILEVQSLLALFPAQSRNQELTVVPLLEKPEDLKHYERIIIDSIKLKMQQKLEEAFDDEEKHQKNTLKNILNIRDRKTIERIIQNKNRKQLAAFITQNPDLKPYLEPIIVEVMIGFSDTERLIGLSALFSIKRLEENLIQLTSQFGVTLKIFHGPGGDANRGGLKRRDPKATLQGNARRVLNTARSTLWYRENQFAQAYRLLAYPEKRMELSILPPQLQESLATCIREGANFYKMLHDPENGLGKLTGLLLGQINWIVAILNSSSRPTQRGVTENTGDRTASIQSIGQKLQSYIHPDKPRAISATQMKEMLRDNLDFLGIGHGLHTIGLEEAERLYDLSTTFRDVIDKCIIGAATRDLSFLEYALFADHPELIPSTPAERDQWAEECLTTSFKDIDIEKMSKNPEKRLQLLTRLSRFIALIDQECQLTFEFLADLMQKVNIGKIGHIEKSTDLLAHCQPWHEQTLEAISKAEPLTFLLARQTHHLARGRYLDQVYPELNEQTIETSQLSGVGRFVGSIGSGITAFRQQYMPEGFTQNISHDVRENLRLGVARAEKEPRLFKKTPATITFLTMFLSEQQEKAKKEEPNPVTMTSTLS